MQHGTDQGKDAGAPEPLRAEAFERFVGGTVEVEGSAVALTLTAVDVFQGRPVFPDGRRPFSLTFRSPPASDAGGGGVLPEGLHRLAFGDGVATHDIYVAPVHTPGGGRQDYEAVFN